MITDANCYKLNYYFPYCFLKGNSFPLVCVYFIPHLWECQYTFLTFVGITNQGSVFLFNFDRLEELRKEKGITATFLCNAVNRSRYYLKDCKAKDVAIPQETINIWADILGTTADYLTDKTDKKEKPTEYDGLSEKQKVIMDFVMSVPDDKAEMILRVMKSILESDK